MPFIACLLSLCGGSATAKNGGTHAHLATGPCVILFLSPLRFSLFPSWYFTDPLGDAKTMSPLETVERFVDRINGRDVEGIAALMTADHRFVDSLGSATVGQEVMREGWRQYFQMVPDYHINITRTFADGAEVALIGSAGGTYSREGRLNPADGWQTPAAWRVVVRDGLVAEWHVYADNEPIRQRMSRTSA
jgi:ketosteroid isomerase-like protein